LLYAIIVCCSSQIIDYGFFPGNNKIPSRPNLKRPGVLVTRVLFGK
jgi:hypothetical protein